MLPPIVFPLYRDPLPAGHTRAAPPAYTRTELCLCGVGHQRAALFELVDPTARKLDDFRMRRKVETDRPLGNERDAMKTKDKLALLEQKFADLTREIAARRNGPRASDTLRRRRTTRPEMRPSYAALDTVWEENRNAK